VRRQDVTPALGGLPAFREGLFGCFGRRADGRFELSDAVSTAGAVRPLAHLSLAPAHRRGWGSLYAALSKGSIDADALRDPLARQPLEERDCGVS